MKEKKKYFETLRGIAIMMVVAVHTFGIASSNFKIEVRELFNCAVPLFFLLSGFFLYQKPLSSKSEVLSFWKRQIPKVYMPVIVWSLPTFLKNIFFNHHSVINEILLLFSCGYNVFYFVAVIIQFYILLPLIKRVDGFNWGGVLLSCVLSFIMVSGVTYYNIVLGMGLPLIVYAGCGLLWGMFFVMGGALSKKERHYSVFLVSFIAIIGFLLSVVESRYLLSNYGMGVGIKPSAFLFSMAMCMLFLSSYIENKYYMIRNSNLIVFGFWEYLGSASFAIYLSHYYIKLYILPLIPFADYSWLTRWATVLFCSILVVEILRRFIPQYYHRFIGIYD